MTMIRRLGLPMASQVSARPQPSLCLNFPPTHGEDLDAVCLIHAQSSTLNITWDEFSA
jgi:hypothetical protein